MKKLIKWAFILPLFSWTVDHTPAGQTPGSKLTKRSDSLYVFSAIRGTTSKPDTLAKGTDFKWLNGDSSAFLISLKTGSTVISFVPRKDFIGTSIATASLKQNGKRKVIRLAGISTKALEGENEAPLSQILEALEYPINIGWQSLAHHCRPALQGEEIKPAQFIKAGNSAITILPLARYSPDFELEFGYYTIEDTVRYYAAGSLSKAAKHPEHQTLYPAYTKYNMTDPGSKKFGFYAKSPSHSAFTDDSLNIRLFPDHVAHAARIYPLKESNGRIVPDSFLLCFEEAKNGDYNDYVFIVRNVKIAE